MYGSLSPPAVTFEWFFQRTLKRERGKKIRPTCTNVSKGIGHYLVFSKLDSFPILRISDALSVSRSVLLPSGIRMDKTNGDDYDDDYNDRNRATRIQQQRRP